VIKLRNIFNSRRARYAVKNPTYTRHELEFTQSLDRLLERYRDEYLPKLHEQEGTLKATLTMIFPLAIDHGFLLNGTAGYAVLVAEHRDEHTERSFGKRRRQILTYYSTAMEHHQVIEEIIDSLKGISLEERRILIEPLKRGMQNLTTVLYHNGFLELTAGEEEPPKPI
jgi:hypothetical protein